MTLAQESALGITLTNPSRLTLKELMRESTQRTSRSPPAQGSASSNYNPNGIMLGSMPGAAVTVNTAPMATELAAPMQIWEEDRPNT
eukprot:3896702-Prorocentrum_lima.AAC.1